MKTTAKENKEHSRSRNMKRLRKDRTPFPGMILVAGDGRNVGKTTFCLQVIRHLSAMADVVAIKTTPHLHVHADGLEILEQTGEYLVAIEKGLHQKDSALMLQAGAKKVYLVVAAQQHLGKAFSRISASVGKAICVAESGGLVEYVEPAVFFFIRNHSGDINKMHYLEFDPVVVTNRDRSFDFEIEKLDIADHKLVMKE